MKFLKRFGWTDKLLTVTEKQAVENILVEYQDIFARHRMDIGMNTEFQVRPLPKIVKAVYSHSLPIHLKEDLFVELALMHKYGVFTVLPFSKYASPIFAQRKPNGKLRLLVDLRKINTLIADDFTNNNHPVSTLSDAARHLAGKTLICLTALRLITVCRLRPNSQWKSLLSISPAELLPTGDLHKVLADLCLLFWVGCASTWTQSSRLTNVLNRLDAIGIAANNATDLIRNIRAVFQCIRNARLKLTTQKCHFGGRQNEFLGRSNSSEGVSPQTHKIQNFLNKL